MKQFDSASFRHGVNEWEKDGLIVRIWRRGEKVLVGLYGSDERAPRGVIMLPFDEVCEWISDERSRRDTQLANDAFMRERWRQDWVWELRGIADVFTPEDYRRVLHSESQRLEKELAETPADSLEHLKMGTLLRRIRGELEELENA